MKAGDKIQVRNIGKEEWANATVTDVGNHDLVKAKVDHPGHELHGKLLTVDSLHYREAPGAPAGREPK